MASSSQNPSQTPATAISPTTSDQLSFEFSQMSIEIGNWRASVQQYLQDQYLETITNINIERSSHDTLVNNFVARLVTLINRKEHELATALSANSVLHRRLADCEATVANLNQQLAMMQRRQEMMEANEPDAGSSCGEAADVKESVVEVSSQKMKKQRADEEE